MNTQQSFKKKILSTHTIAGRKITVWEVDGAAVRNTSKELMEFAGCSTHVLHKFVPRDEIWVGDTNPDEYKFLVPGALEEIRTNNYELGLMAEAELRWKAKQKAHKPKNLARDPHTDREGTYWCVDGRIVRDDYKTDFALGGNWMAYPGFIPKGEIWLEENLDEEEEPFILIHEQTESELMTQKGLSYEKAHKLASEAEWKAREAAKK